MKIICTLIKKLLGILFLLIIFSCTKDPSISPGHQAPNFTLLDLKDNEHTLSAYKGNIVLLNFWASWCAPCIEEMPTLQRLNDKFKNNGLKIITIAVDDQKEALEKIAENLKLTLPVLLDTKAKIRNTYKVSGYPESFIIDKNGKLILFADPANAVPSVRIIGPRKWDEIEYINIFRSLLKENEHKSK